MRLKNKICLVTGAARGIGEAIASAYVAEGAEVWVTDVDLDGACRVAGILGADAAGLDVREPGHWQSVIDALLAKKGRLDVLVNNAGITGFEECSRAQDPEHATLEDWHAVHRTNLDGVFLGCQHGIRAMRKHRSGSIINISSRSGVVGIPAAAAYASSKAAVRNHTKSVALYCAENGLAIRCNSIHPAAILTPMWDAMLGQGEERAKRMEEFTATTPLRRFGSTAEVAAVAVLLASDESAYITGSEIHVDGGLLAGVAAAPRKP